jgi:ceramide glucosyltransferase
MLLRRSQAERFGGLASLGRYLAEDYMAGKAMAYLGLRVRVASRPVRQPIGALRFREFWSRHLRWGRIRRSQAPIAHALELAVSAIPSGLLGALAAQCLFGGGGGVVFAAHCLLWIGCDAAQTRALGGRFRWLEAAAWVARESLAAPLWLHVILGRTVMWRGHELRLGRGGLLLEEAPADTLLWAAPREEGRA